MSNAFTNPLSLFDLADHQVLITGSGSGIGLAMARALASSGASVILNGRNHDKIRKAEKIIVEAGGKACASIFDISDSDAINSAVTDIEENLGPIDVLINNAGTNRRGSMAEITSNDFSQVIQTNVNGTFCVTQSVSKNMIERGSGKIINICSALSKLGRKNAVAYSASKAAVAMMTRSMCDELAPHGIQVNGIAPGYFLTELTQVIADTPAHNDWLIKRTPAGRWGKMEDLIGATIFFSSSASDFVNGHVLYVDGGLTSVIGG